MSPVVLSFLLMFAFQLSLVLVFIGAFIKQGWINVNTKLQSSVHQAKNSSNRALCVSLPRALAELRDLLVPVRFRCFVQCWEYQGHNHLYVFSHKTDNIVIIPIVQGSFGYLKMRTSDALTELDEQGTHDLLEFRYIDNIENFLYFIQKHNLF